MISTRFNQRLANTLFSTLIVFGLHSASNASGDQANQGTESHRYTNAQEQGRGRGFQQPRPSVDRTTAIAERMTPAEKIHAALHGANYRTSSRVLDELASVTKYLHGVGGDEPTLSSQALLARAACSADLVFVGRVSSAKALPTSDGSFLFTDYSVDVTNVVRRDLRRPGQPSPKSVVVTRPGGRIVVGGAVVTAEVSSWPLLDVDGRYLFFGTLIPDTGAYQIDGPVDTLEIANGKLTGVTRWSRKSDDHLERGTSVTAAVEELRKLDCQGRR